MNSKSALSVSRSPLVPERFVWLAFVPYIIMSIVHVAALWVKDPIAAPTKLMLMPLLALAVILAAVGVKGLRVVTLGILVFGIFTSWLGDGSATFFPMFDDELPMMLLNFGIAHLAYMYIFWRHIGSSRIGASGKKQFLHPAAYLYVIAFVVLVGVIAPNAGALAVPVTIYAAVLTGTAMLATRVSSVVALGGFWFLASDAILGFRIFLPDVMPGWTSPAVMITYTLGQGLIGYGVVKVLRARARG